jgi:hypothetical protein
MNIKLTLVQLYCCSLQLTQFYIQVYLSSSTNVIVHLSELPSNVSLLHVRLM